MDRPAPALPVIHSIRPETATPPALLPPGPLVIQTVYLPDGRTATGYVPAPAFAPDAPTVGAKTPGPLLPRWVAGIAVLSLALSVSAWIAANALRIADQALAALVADLILLGKVLLVLAVLVGAITVGIRILLRRTGRRGTTTATATAVAVRRGLLGSAKATATAIAHSDR
jgi:hypothetical protein